MKHIILLAFLFISSVTLAYDERDHINKNLVQLGYCYQFPAVYQTQAPDSIELDKNQLDNLVNNYIDVVLEAPQDSVVYRNRLALDEGRNQFLQDVTFLDEPAIEQKNSQCRIFLDRYIKRVMDIEKRNQAAQISPQ